MVNMINLTPHEVKIVEPSAIKMERSGLCYLKEDVSEDDEGIIIAKIPTSGISLTVQEDSSVPETIDEIRLYKQLGNARFDRVLQEETVKDNDIIIVSSKCARLLLVLANSILVGTPHSKVPNIETVFDIDRFYTPKSIVHKTINGKNNPIGALGLQQVSSSLPAKMYAEEIMNNPDKEIPVSAASCFNTYQDMLKVQEYYNIEETNDMKILKEYLTKRGIKL